MTDSYARRQRMLAALTISVTLLATACGGGSGAPAPAPSPSPPASPTPPPPPPPPPAPPPGDPAMLGSCLAFPTTAIFNTRIDDVQRFPPHGSSGTWIANIGATRALHAD
jgi:hypothetical protein